jgi:hypothetical protein
MCITNRNSSAFFCEMMCLPEMAVQLRLEHNVAIFYPDTRKPRLRQNKTI